MNHYLIIGSGISGAAAAFELARQGHQVHLIESSPTIGGAVLGYSCKATDECSRCGVCVAHTQLSDTVRDEHIITSVGVSIQSVMNTGEHLDIDIIRKNPAISYHACTTCDTCVRACPEQCITKIQRAEFIQYRLDYEKCRLHQGKPCSICADACPTNTITAQTPTTEMTLSGDAVLIATGHAPYDATRKIRLGYGRLNNVMTGVEAEEILGKQMLLGEPAERIAFVQCVGSRDPHIGRNYCSSVCCAYALRLARIIKHRSPETEITIYYIDIQHFDKTFTLFRKSVEESGVRFSRGVPFSVEQSSRGTLKLHIENMNGETSIVEYDRVVLSVGMGPAENSDRLLSLFKLEQDAFGFFSSSLPNVFVSGTCKEPLSIPDSMASARSAALEMLYAANGSSAGSVRTESLASGASADSTRSESFETQQFPLQQGVLVVGGGFAGMTTAKEIQRFGYTVTVIDQSEQPGGVLQNVRADLFPHKWPFSPEIVSGVRVLTESALTGLTGNLGNFSACVQTPDGEKTVPCGAIVVASGIRLPTEVSQSSHIISMTEIELALADLVKRRGVRSIGLLLDMNRDENMASMEIALKLAKDIQQRQRFQAYLFCRDVRVAAKNLELLYDEAREMGVNIVKYDGTPSLHITERGVMVSYHDAILRQDMTLYCDRIGLSPFSFAAGVQAQFTEMTGLSFDRYGQLQENNIHLFPEQTNRPGIFVVGACRGQSYIPRLIDEAKSTALAIHQLLSQKSLEVELSNAVIDPDKCVLCLTCLRSCPHKAIRINHEEGAAESIPEACQKCGICAGECPAKAIELPAYTDTLILKQVNDRDFT